MAQTAGTLIIPGVAAVASVVRAYLEAVAGHDWDTASGLLSDDVSRIGPFGDTYTGRASYLEFLAGVMPSLRGYRMDIERVIEGSGSRTAVAELTETVEVDGAALVTPEVLVFDVDADDLITSIRIYIRQTAKP